MKNTSLILSIISLIAVVVFGILTISKDGKKADTVVTGVLSYSCAAIDAGMHMNSAATANAFAIDIIRSCLFIPFIL